jgi:hypothetical protein
MTKDEALKLALETLEQIQEGCNNVIADKLHSDAVDLAKLVRKDCNKPIDAIRKSLAQPETEPKKISESWATHGGLWIESLYKHQGGMNE